MSAPRKDDCPHLKWEESGGVTRCAFCGKVLVIDLMEALKASLEKERARREEVSR